MWQNIIVGVIILLAAVYVFRRLSRSIKPKSGSGCGCGCGSGAGCDSESQPQPAPFILEKGEGDRS